MSQTRAPYLIEKYGRTAPFSSFLPGVAGELGIPLWCFYVNRGQAIASFGSRDKHHSIMEFSPANTSYQRVQTMGFRTFIKMNGKIIEPFSDGTGDMLVDENMLTIRWKGEGLQVEVRYFIIPSTELGALARRVNIQNCTDETVTLEVLDGMCCIVPYGLNQHDLKMMGQTAKAWMMVEALESRLPYFRLRASLVDTTSVAPIEDGSFGAAQCEGSLLPVLADPAVLFGWDTSCAFPVAFEEKNLDELLHAHQRVENELPCCFFGVRKALASQGELKADSIYGLAHGQEQVKRYAASVLDPKALNQKEREAAELLSPYASAIQTHTADPLFDRYCRQTYIDNFLRGGVPHIYRSQGHTRLFYLYSRKHGDLERDYNDFVITPEYASQGNGNYRDILQNRRSDVRFCPEAGWEPLRPFLELIQADGYNPLVLQPVTFLLKQPPKAEWTAVPQMGKLLETSFTPGDLMMVLQQSALPKETQQKLLEDILCAASPQVNAVFAEGYWVDHWIYLLDVLESYLSVYPEKKHDLLNCRCLRWYESRATVLPLAKRCVLTENGLRQHHALDHNSKAAVEHNWLLDASGEEVVSTVLEKLFMLCILKFAALDAFGEGVSMEAGKPGWYDALNGLPGLFGSSTAELCELWRTLHFISDALREQPQQLQLPQEMQKLARQIAQIAGVAEAHERWLAATAALESYRAETEHHVTAAQNLVSHDEALQMVQALLNRCSSSVTSLINKNPGVFPTYFTNLVSDWQADENGITPIAFDHQPLPPFLEGTVHALRLPLDNNVKIDLIRRVKNSSLWDDKLHMYKVSADLSKETPELGRANAFTRGWLEHESIWLHMEYKYLLEMLKNGFYDLFFEAFSDTLIPFQPAQRYGRSLLENSSFLASSANPDPTTHGRGFVARLSGATAEFLDMWQTMFFGRQPFSFANGKLTLRLSPALPARLIPEDGVVRAMFLGHTEVIYHLPDQTSITPNTHCASEYRLIEASGQERQIVSCVLCGTDAEDVRRGKYQAIHVIIKTI